MSKEFQRVPKPSCVVQFEYAGVSSLTKPSMGSTVTVSLCAVVVLASVPVVFTTLVPEVSFTLRLLMTIMPSVVVRSSWQVTSTPPFVTVTEVTLLG